MPRKPANLQYGVDEVPPASVIVLAALQYVAVLTAFLVFPLIMTRAAHAPAAVSDSVLSWSLIVLAIATCLQGLSKGPIGSGCLAPSTMTAVYVGPSLDAVRVGGLALMSGMTMFGGVAEAVLSRSMHKLRALLPLELAGVVIMLVATDNGMLGFRYLLRPQASQGGDLRVWVVAGLTLACTIVLSVWGRGILRSSCALIGLLVGYAAAIIAGLVPRSAFAALTQLAPLQVPRVGYFAWHFDALMIAPFLIAALANTLKAAALITTADRLADADWVRPDAERAGGGVLADGLSNVLAGMFCSFGTNVSTTSVGLNDATGVASRVVAYAIGGIFLVLAFIPPLMQLFTLIPDPVIGATLIFTSCAILKNGIETITSRMLDARRTMVVGLSLLAGLAVEVFPSVFRHLPHDLQPLLGSSLVLGTFVGLALNALFRIGARRTSVLQLDPAQIDFEAVQTFMEGRGGAWGARRDVVARATYAAQQMAEVIAENCEPQGAISLSGSFDEFDLMVEARYAGIPLELPERRPSEAEIRENEDGVRLLAGFLLRHNADRASSMRRGGVSLVRFHFGH